MFCLRGRRGGWWGAAAGWWSGEAAGYVGSTFDAVVAAAGTFRGLIGVLVHHARV